MEIKGCVHCLFEQSGTFKNEFKKLGYQAYDYDIQNNFGETDYVIDLFGEIEKCYGGGYSMFDKITPDDLIVAFFPCIYFTGSSNPLEFCLATHKNLTECQRIEKIIDRSQKREHLYELLLKLVSISIDKKIPFVFENPYSTQSYLCNNFLKKPDVFDKNRMLRGDYFVKPTGFWFFNCEPTNGFTTQNDKKQKIVRSLPGGKGDGLCSEERSMISPDYARNWICDFILGKKQQIGQMNLL